MEFSSKKELYKHLRENVVKIEVVHQTSAVNHLKSAGTKNCKLCMQERINLFHAFSKKKNDDDPGIMNSRTELYSKCSCKTRFARLCAVENKGADETASQPKTAVDANAGL